MRQICVCNVNHVKSSLTFFRFFVYGLNKEKDNYQALELLAGFELWMETGLLFSPA